MARSEVTVQRLDEAAYEEWNRLVADSPNGSVYSTPEYLDALCSAAGGHFCILGVRHGDVLAGGVALYEQQGAFGAYVSPRLLLYYNGPVLRRYDTKYPSEQTGRQLKTLAALESALSGGYASVVLKGRPTLTDARPFLARGWRVRVGYTYVVPLGQVQEARGRIDQNLRRLIDRCGREGLVFTEDDDFESFYRLHAGTMDRLDVGVYLPREMFRSFHQRLAAQGLCRIYHARLPDGRPVATQLVLLGAHPVTHTVSAAADAEFMNRGVSPFLRWKVFERLSALGYQANDLTDASLNPVTHFKSQLGGNLEPWLELVSPETLRFRWGRRAEQAAQLTRSAVGAPLRVLRRRAGRS